MQNFLSAFAQVTATLFTLFLAAVTAYFVFLQDRSTQFSDKVTAVKLDMRDQLLQLRTTWPWTLTYLPPDFKAKYRSRHPNKSGADLVAQAAADLLFQNRELIDTVHELRSKDAAGPWQGRVYFFVLTEGVTVITVGTPDTLTKPEGVFPSSAEGPGFGQWRAAFNKLRVSLRILRDVRPSMKADFHRFILPRQEASSSHTAVVEDLHSRAIDAFFQTVESVGAKLNEIEKLELSLPRYSFAERVHWRWIAPMSLLGRVPGRGV